jgi:hypothetical protein
MEVLCKREKPQQQYKLQIAEPLKIFSSSSSRSRKSRNRAHLKDEYIHIQFSLLNLFEQTFHFHLTDFSQPFQLIFENFRPRSIIVPSKFKILNNHSLNISEKLIKLQKSDHFAMNPSLLTFLKQLILEPRRKNFTDYKLLLSYYSPHSFRCFQNKRQYRKQVETLMLFKLEAITNPFFIPFIIPMKQLIKNTFPNTKRIRILLQATNQLTETILKTERNNNVFPITIFHLFNFRYFFQHPINNLIKLTKSYIHSLYNTNYKFLRAILDAKLPLGFPNDQYEHQIRKRMETFLMINWIIRP